MVKKDKVRLGDVCTIVSGTTPKTVTKEYWDGELNWITPAELSDDIDIIYKTERKITNKAVTDSSLKLLPVGTVLLSSRAPIGKVAIVGSPMYCNQGFKNLICSNSIFNKFLYWFLKGKKDFLNSLGRGATFKEISKSIVADIQIPLPPLSEQKRIAGILDKATELIALRKQQIQKLDLLVKSRFIEMFGEPTSNTMGWNKYPLGKRCKILTGNTPSRSESGNYGSFIEWIKSDNINTPNIYLTTAQEYLSEKGFKKCRYVEAGSILMTCIAGSIGCIGNVAVANRRVSFNQQINAIIPNKDETLYIYCLMQLAKKYIQDTVNISLKGILNKGKLSTLEFPFPPQSIQKDFVSFVKRVDKTKSTLQQSLEKLELNYKALMQTYFG